MLLICGLDCCGKCDQKHDCGGCVKTDGRAFGGTCVASECVSRGGLEELKNTKETLIKELNALGIQGLQVRNLNLMNGSCINLEYTLTNGQSVKLLEDNRIYWANQIDIPGSDRCYVIAADEGYLLVCEYGCNGAEPQIIVYKRR